MNYTPRLKEDYSNKIVNELKDKQPQSQEKDEGIKSTTKK